MLLPGPIRLCAEKRHRDLTVLRSSVQPSTVASISVVSGCRALCTRFKLPIEPAHFLRDRRRQLEPIAELTSFAVLQSELVDCCAAHEVDCEDT